MCVCGFLGNYQQNPGYENYGLLTVHLKTNFKKSSKNKGSVLAVLDITINVVLLLKNAMLARSIVQPRENAPVPLGKCMLSPLLMTHHYITLQLKTFRERYAEAVAIEWYKATRRKQ